MTMMFNFSGTSAPSCRDSELRPPWHVYPELSPGDYGWRCGAGETYLNRWATWFFDMEPTQREAYLRRHHVPGDWAQCSDSIHG